MLITLTRNFESDDTPLSNEDLSEQLKIPVKLVNELLYMLEQEKIVIKIDRRDGEYYTLIRPPQKITINQIIKYINSYKEVDLAIHPDKELTYINNLFKDVDKVVSNSRAKKTLSDVILELKKA